MRSCFLALRDLPPLSEDEEDLGFAEANLFWAGRTNINDQPTLSETEAFLRAAETLGFDRAAFRRFQPSRPGFVTRAKVALVALAGHGNNAESPPLALAP
jgi:hypothetical protein